MQTIDLRSEGTVSGLKGYIVCGTNYAYGEDVTSRGRVGQRSMWGAFSYHYHVSVVIFVTADDTFIVIIDIVDWLEHSPCNVESSPLRWLMM